MLLIIVYVVPDVWKDNVYQATHKAFSVEFLAHSNNFFFVFASNHILLPS